MSGLVLIVRLNGQRVAIPADAVSAVVELDEIAPVPRAAHHVKGLAALRSRVLTVIDTYRAIGLVPPGDASREAVIVELDGRIGHTELGWFKDMWRDNLSATEGWQTLRYGAFDLTHRPCEVAQQVGYVLRLNGWIGFPTPCAKCRQAP